MPRVRAAGGQAKTALPDTVATVVKMGRNEMEDVAVKKSSLQSVLQVRAEERNGCMSLPFTILFFTCYTMGIMSHEDVRSVYLVESSMREFIEEYSFDVDNSRTLEGIVETKDFWLFIKDALLPAMFVQTDHMGKALPKTEWGRVLAKNRLKGGILLEQFRNEKFQSTNTTADFLHFPGEGISLLADIPGGGSAEARKLLAKDFPALEGMEGFEADDRRLRKAGGGGSMSSKSGAAAGVAAIPYPFFLFEQEPMDTLVKRVNYLEEINWIDHHTTELNIKMVLVNEDLKLIQHVRIGFVFPTSGGISSKVFFSSSFTKAYSNILGLVFDIVYMLLLSSLLVQEGKEAVLVYNRGELKTYLKDIWNCIDWASIFFGFAVIGMFVLERKSVAGLNDQLGTTGGDVNVDYWTSMYKLHVDAQSLSNTAMWYRLLLANYTMIIMMRFFKAFKGQARLAVVTNTIVHASSDLLHFGIVFLSAFLTYTFAGMVLFGRRLDGFSSFQKSFGTCFAIAAGDFDWGEISKEHIMSATLWFWSFMILIFLIMLNMVLAIVMDVYTSVRSEALHGDPIWVNIAHIYKKAKEYKHYLHQKAINSPDIPERDVPDSEIMEALRNVGQSGGAKITMARLQAAIPNLSDTQAQHVLADVELWEKRQTEQGMNMSDAIQMIKTINNKVEGLVRKIDHAHSMDPKLKEMEDPKMKALRAKRKFKRAIFTALKNGELERVAAQLQSETVQDECRERDLTLKIQRANNLITPVGASGPGGLTKPGSLDVSPKGEQKKDQKQDQKMLKEVQALKSQTKALESSIADMSCCLKSLVLTVKNDEERESTRHTVDHGRGDNEENRSPSVPTKGRRKRRISPERGFKGDTTAIEARLDQMSTTLYEMKQMNLQKEMIDTTDTPLGSAKMDGSTEARILEMCLLMKDLHRSVHTRLAGDTASRSRPQSANSTSGMDKATGLLMRDIRNLSHRTQSIGTMMMEVLRSLNDVRATSMLQAQIIENSLQTRNLDIDTSHREYDNPVPHHAPPPARQAPPNASPWGGHEGHSRPQSAGGNFASPGPMTSRPQSAGGNFASPGPMPQNNQFGNFGMPPWTAAMGGNDPLRPHTTEGVYESSNPHANQYIQYTQSHEDLMGSMDPSGPQSRYPYMQQSSQQPPQFQAFSGIDDQGPWIPNPLAAQDTQEGDHLINNLDPGEPWIEEQPALAQNMHSPRTARPHSPAQNMHSPRTARPNSPAQNMHSPRTARPNSPRMIDSSIPGMLD